MTHTLQTKRVGLVTLAVSVRLGEEARQTDSELDFPKARLDVVEQEKDDRQLYKNKKSKPVPDPPPPETGEQVTLRNEQVLTGKTNDAEYAEGLFKDARGRSRLHA